MLRNFLVVATLCCLISTGCKPTKDDYRNDFVKGCVNRYAKDSTVANTEGRLLVEEYCLCMGKNLDDQMDVEA